MALEFFRNSFETLKEIEGFGFEGTNCGQMESLLSKNWISAFFILFLGTNDGPPIFQRMLAVVFHKIMRKTQHFFWNF